MTLNVSLFAIVVAFASIAIVYTQSYNFVSLPRTENISYTAIACPQVLTNTSKTQLLLLINETKIENAEGACALDALKSYNNSNTLAHFNISINLTNLNQKYRAGLPNITIVNSSTAPSFPSNPSLHCVVSPSFDSKSLNASANKTRILMCVAKGQPPREGNKTFHFNITLPSNVTKGPEVIFIPNASTSNITLTIQNSTLIVINGSKVNPPVRSSVTNNALSTALKSDGLLGNDITPNWAGYIIYAQDNGGTSFTGINGSWVVQKALSRPSLIPAQSAQWIGVGGSETGLNLIQIGTESNNDSTPFAWYEEYPSGINFGLPVPISNFTVRSGDRIAASMQLNLTEFKDLGMQVWTVKIRDINSHSNFSKILPPTFSADLSTSEWIDERPGLLTGGYHDFTNFINASFTSANTSQGLITVKSVLNSFNYVRDLMVNGPDRGNNAQPFSPLLSNGGFNVTNFRVGALSTQNQIIVLGQNDSISLNTIINLSNRSTVMSGVGGTGAYSYLWLVRFPHTNTYINATMCLIPLLPPLPLFYVYEPYCNFKTNSSTQTGNYSFELQVHSKGGPPNETLTTAPITITVTSLTACGAPAKVDIILSNRQSVSTGPNFQQMIVVNSSRFASAEASDLHNVEFFYSNCTVIPAWIESGNSNGASSTIYWLKLANGIPANKNITITLGFMPFSTNNFLNGSRLGEAPQLSPTYAQYDNGANVFNFYDNFKGPTLNNAWNAKFTGPFPGFKGNFTYCINFNSITSTCMPPFYKINSTGLFISNSASGPFSFLNASSLYSVNNGLSLNATPMPETIFSLKNQSVGPLAIDTYAYTGMNASFGSEFSNLQTNTTTFSFNFISGAVQILGKEFFVNNQTFSPTTFEFLITPTVNATKTALFPTTTPQIASLALNSSSATASEDYINNLTAKAAMTLTAHPGIFRVSVSNKYPRVNITWFRIRAFPPNGVMPAATDPNTQFGNANSIKSFIKTTIIATNSNVSKMKVVTTGTITK